MITGLAIVVLAATIATWINDYTTLGGQYLDDEQMTDEQK